MIYEAGEHGMRIYAYKENVPGPDTVLYAAPFFNVTGSSVCLGNARIELPKDLTYEKLLQYWEKEILAYGIHPPGREREPDKVKPRAGDKGGTGQGLQPRRTEATEQHET